MGKVNFKIVQRKLEVDKQHNKVDKWNKNPKMLLRRQMFIWV